MQRNVLIAALPTSVGIPPLSNIFLSRSFSCLNSLISLSMGFSFTTALFLIFFARSAYLLNTWTKQQFDSCHKNLKHQRFRVLVKFWSRRLDASRQLGNRVPFSLSSTAWKSRRLNNRSSRFLLAGDRPLMRSLKIRNSMDYYHPGESLWHPKHRYKCKIKTIFC